MKIIKYYLLIFFISVASAHTFNNVWTAGYSAFVGSDESVTYENYLIKVKILDSTKATITVSKGPNLVEALDFNVNDFKKYDNIGITLLGIKGNYSWISISELENKDIWRPMTRTRLNWSETYTIENYTFNVDTFGNDSVNLIISNESTAQTVVLAADGSKDYRNLRVAVRDINRTGFIDIEFFTNKVPGINAEVSTEKSEYFPDEPVNVTVNISSDAVQNIVGITLDAFPHAEIRQGRFAEVNVTGTRSFHSQITRPPANSTVTISARIETRDFYNNPYTTTVSRDILITPVISINKSVPADTDDENVTVRLYVYNSGSGNRSIHIHDTVPAELTARNMDWDIELAPGMTKTLEYNVTPQKPGMYSLPAAMALWEGGSSAAEKVNMNVHMPYISIIKTAAYDNGRTHVNLVISNTGDRPAQVKLSDIIPQGYPLADGSTAWSGKLEGGESAALGYSLRGNAENLPAAGATYRDMRGTVRRAQSNTIEPKVKRVTGVKGNIDNKEKAPDSKPAEMVSSMISSFIVIAGIIAGAALVVYLLAALKRRR